MDNLHNYEKADLFKNVNQLLNMIRYINGINQCKRRKLLNNVSINNDIGIDYNILEKILINISDSIIKETHNHDKIYIEMTKIYDYVINKYKGIEMDILEIDSEVNMNKNIMAGVKRTQKHYIQDM
jgi:hypothetical protein